MAWEFWIDRGGTFTDLIGTNERGEQIVQKVLSEQPGKQGDPSINAIRRILELEANKPIPLGVLKEVRLGTTVATNTLLENLGNPVILFCNAGLKDLLIIGDQHRPDLFSLEIKKTKPLFNDVVEVSGRIDSKGFEIVPIAIDKEVEDRLQRYAGDKTISIAIAFLNSYINPTHELQLKEWLINQGFSTVICSCEVSPLPRIIPRGRTTLTEASISPILHNYLSDVANRIGNTTKLRIMGSSGALLLPDNLLAKDTILSGPAGGMVGALVAVQKSNHSSGPIIGFDMGGTSTDVFFVDPDQIDNLQREDETEVGGHKLLASRLPIHTVAAGGGSIIFETEGRLRVGPRSAGSNPGPACYRNGGPLTITDANVLLGRLQSENFPALFGSSGTQHIDLHVVVATFKELAKKLRSTPEEIAEGALTIALERMANAIKQVSIMNGNDIRNGILVAYGGAGGGHACRLADALGIKKILLHPFAGVLSAYGIGVACQTEFSSIVLQHPLTKDLLKKVQILIKQEIEKAKLSLKSKAKCTVTAKEYQTNEKAWIEIRYKSKDQGLILSFQDNSTIEKIKSQFEKEHLKRFGYKPQNHELLIIERLKIEVKEVTSSKDKTVSKNVDKQRHTPRETVRMHISNSGWQLVPCITRQNIPENSFLKGPALILDSTCTTILESGWNATLDSENNLILQTSNQNSSYRSSNQNKKSTERPDPILLELFNHRFCGIAEKMGERLRQTSRSINIRERLDFSCAIFDSQGELIANAPHIPVHLGAMSDSVIDLIGQVAIGKKKQLQPLETVITNDPFHGGTHLPDITAITPIFAGGKSPQYYVASRGHHSDIGGVTPGSMPPFSKRIEEEGLLLRNKTFIIDGKYDHLEWENLLSKGENPPRNQLELIADLHAQVAANQLGVLELQQLIRKEGKNLVDAYINHLHKNAIRSVEKLITTLEDGNYSVELDNGAKIGVEIKVDKSNNLLVIDFTSTSAQTTGNFQAPLAVTKSSVLYVIRCLLDDDIPLNSGCFKPLKIIVPEGSLLNPLSPSAVVAGNVETSQALCNVLLGAFNATAASQGTMNNLTFGDENKQYYETIAGGSGAGNGFNGSDGIQTHMTNSRLTDPEILEQRYPVRLEIFQIRGNSGGIGKWKGGNGLIRKIRFLKPMTVSILSSSRRIAPFGLSGGGCGATGKNYIETRNRERKELPGCASIEVKTGEAIVIKTPGGGGYGEEISDNNQKRTEC